MLDIETIICYTSKNLIYISQDVRNELYCRKIFLFGGFQERIKMAIRAIGGENSYQSRKSNGVSPVGAGAVGALAGYGLKYALPVSEYEKKHARNLSVAHIIDGAERNGKKAEYKAILNEFPEDSCIGHFLTQAKNRKEILDNKFDLKKAGENIPEGLETLLERINQRGLVEKKKAQEMFEAFAKRSRPTFYFIALGIIVLTSIVCLGNGLLSAEQQK